MKYLVWQFYKTKKGSICIHEKCTKFMSFWYKGALVDYICKLIFKNYTPREHCFEILCQWIQGNLWCNFCWIAYQYLIDFFWQKVDKMMENLKELNSNTMVFKIFFFISMRFPHKGGKWLILCPSEEKIKTWYS